MTEPVPQTEVLQMPLPAPDGRLCVCCRQECVKAFCSVDCGRFHFAHGQHTNEPPPEARTECGVNCSCLGRCQLYD